MILIGLGSNITGPWGNPRTTVERALICLNQFPLRLLKSSSLLATKPFGNKNQPDFINAVAMIETALPPIALLSRLHDIERKAGRKRAKRWGPRTLDLDILDYKGRILNPQGKGRAALRLPHEGIAVRDFVVLPLAEIAPRWKHPQLLKTAKEMIHKPFGLNRV
ncbi:MAG: 2-amino-4-hydroxy-6-hydroxymethyldihydropteridine diphosphokinase [Aestuariivirga sp.]